MQALTPDVPFSKLSFVIHDFPNLREDVLRLAESGQWLNHVNQKDYHGQWQVMPLRGLTCHNNAHPLLQAFEISCDNPQDYMDYPVMEQVPGVGNLLAQLGCGVLSARLMKLAPGSRISPHRDHGLCFSKGQVRLHLSLVSDEQVTFTVDGKVVPIYEGELWYINADKLHSVVSHSKENRIHLVVDCLSNEWLQTMIAA